MDRAVNRPMRRNEKKICSARPLYLLSTSIRRNNSHNTYFPKAITAVAVYLSKLTVLEVLWERTENKSETCKTIDLLKLVCLSRYFYLLVKHCIPLRITRSVFHGTLQCRIRLYIKLWDKVKNTCLLYKTSLRIV